MATVPPANSMDPGHSLDLRLVTGSDWEPEWNRLVQAHHYLGCRKLLGRRLKYLAFVQGEPAATLAWSAPARKLGTRDRFIGWPPPLRQCYLDRLAANSRFVIFPWARAKNLASRVLGRNLRRLRADWNRCFHRDLWLVETFVDPRHFRGTGYRATNWRRLGTTRGYTKWGQGYRYHGRTKDVYVYVLEPRLWDHMGCFSTFGVTPVPKSVEAIGMALQSQSWPPSSLAQWDLDPEATQAIADELVAFHHELRHCFARSEPQRLGLAYLSGLLGDTAGKSAEPIALETLGASSVRALQRFMKDAPWDHEAMLRTHQRNMAHYLASPRGMITVDSSEFPKKGTDSVGVARQYRGRLGKTENCQSGVFAGYTSDRGHALIDCQLYMPRQWLEAEYADRRAKHRVPEDLAFRTKPEIAQQLIHRASETFDACWIGCDAAFGSDDAFLRALPEGLYYFADVKGTEKVFPEKPEGGVPAYGGKGRPPSKKRVLAGEPCKVAEIAQREDLPWQTVKLGEGAKGPLFNRVACLRVDRCRETFPQEEPVWLFIRQQVDGPVRFALSNAPADTSLQELGRASTLRWPIEQCFAEGKSHLGMAAYEHRSWPAWHRHMIYVLLAQQFLFRVRKHLKKNAKLEPPGGAIPPADRTASPLTEPRECAGNP